MAGNSKIVFGDEVLIDLTSDSVTASKLLKNYTAHDKAGDPITGTCTFDSDTTDATAEEGEILLNKTAYVNKVKVIGKMASNGGQKIYLSALTDSKQILQGYHDGSGRAEIASAEKAKIVANNIKSGVTILGVTGSYGGEEIKAEGTKTVAGVLAGQTITPSSGYDYMTEVVIQPISYVSTPNAAGGNTITIG